MDFCQSEPDFTKVPLYQPDQLIFLHKDDSPLFTEEHQTTISTTTPPCSSDSSASATSSSSSSSWPPPSYDLQQVLLQYRSQPDLLQLILESKLQEDRRRTEEARLRAKELDLMLLQHHQHQGSFTTTSLLSSVPPPQPQPQPPSSPSDHHHHHHPIHLHHPNSITSLKQRESFNNTTDNTSDELDEAFFLQQMSSSLPESIDTQHESLSPPCPIPEFYHKETIMTSHQKPRKRREMQAITKLVETRDNPYLDGHFWRNNGNTIQKKTGNKSVYFKCSNSTKGCPVNKTSTFCQETGEYLIKYRGEHLAECGKVQHIVEV